MKSKTKSQPRKGKGGKQENTQGKRKCPKVHPESHEVPAKVKAPKAKAKAKSKSKGSTQSPTLVDSVVPTLRMLLKECYVPDCKCECDHMGFEVPQYSDENVQLSIYWTRNAVGVKMKESSLPQHIRKNKAVWQQISYFGSGTCPYVNIALADHYVLPSKHLSIMPTTWNFNFGIFGVIWKL